MTEVIHEILHHHARRQSAARGPRRHAERPDDFNDPANVTVQELALTDEGIAELSLTRAAPSNVPAPAVAGAPLRRPPARRPAAWLKFDDGLVGQPATRHARRSRAPLCPVAGNKTLWKKGVSGTALAFDGYFSKVDAAQGKGPAITDELTLEAWVALGAYPWNDAGIVHCRRGADRPGGLQARLPRPLCLPAVENGGLPAGRGPVRPAHLQGQRAAGRRRRARAPRTPSPARDVLPTYRWTHLAATYGGGRMCLYVDGKLVASEPASGPIACRTGTC